MTDRERKLALICMNTYAGKEYCLDEWVAAYNALTYEPRTTFVVDNTAVSMAYTKLMQDKGLNAIHYQPFLDKPIEHTYHRGWELILEKAIELDAFWLYSVEADNIPAPESLEKMVDLAEYGDCHLVTHDYALHQAAADASRVEVEGFRYCEFGCMLLSRALLEKALENYGTAPDFSTMAGAVFNTNYRHKGGHIRLMQTFEVGHLDGFNMEYQQGFAEPEWNTGAFAPTPFVPEDFSTVLPPSLEGSAQIVHVAPDETLKLDLGSGGQRIPGYVSVDFDEATLPDVVASVEELPFADETVDALYASHVLEHVKLQSPALAEWRRVLKPGGLITVAVPDIVEVYELSREGGLWGDGWPMDLVYVNATAFGANLLAENGNSEWRRMYSGPGHEHKQIFVGDMLEERLRAAGFVDVRRVARCEVRFASKGETMVEGRKPDNVKEHHE